MGWEKKKKAVSLCRPEYSPVRCLMNYYQNVLVLSLIVRNSTDITTPSLGAKWPLAQNKQHWHSVTVTLNTAIQSSHKTVNDEDDVS